MNNQASIRGKYIAADLKEIYLDLEMKLTVVKDTRGLSTYENDLYHKFELANAYGYLKEMCPKWNVPLPNIFSENAVAIELYCIGFLK